MRGDEKGRKAEKGRNAEKMKRDVTRKMGNY
jgi:hypothetical protein